MLGLNHFPETSGFTSLDYLLYTIMGRGPIISII